MDIKEKARHKSKFEINDDVAKNAAAIMRDVEHLGKSNKIDVPDKILNLADLADDIPHESLPIEKVMMNTKNNRGRYFVVPIVVE